MSAEDRLQTLEQIREAVLASEAPIPGGDLEAFWRLLGGSLALSLEDKEKLAGSLDKLGAEGLRDLVRTLEEEAVFYNDLVRDPVVCDELADAVRGGRMSGIRDVRGARELAQESGSPRIEVVSRMFACERWPDPAAIEREYRALIALDPDYVLPWKKLGDLVLKMGKLDAAEPLYRKAIALDFGYALPRKKLADLLMGLERFEESEKYYRQAISLDPDYARSWHNLGLLMARTDRLEEAEEACREAVRMDSTYAGAWLTLGQIMDARGNLEGAEAALLQVIALKPGHRRAAAALMAVRARMEASLGEQADEDLGIRPDEALPPEPEAE
jgi:tetratricopeptide (TPR) repeat protein